MAEHYTYLPFLGRTVMPKTKVITNLPPNVKVIYWAAHPANKVIDIGVTKTDENGKAILQFLMPSAYKGTLTHYRYWTSSGMASRVFTEKYSNTN
jgi:hypothetical protein